MERPTVILADADYDYLESLELRFVEKFGNEMELIVITEPEYFRNYFQELRSAEVLLVSEAFYSPELCRHEIGKMIVLSESVQGQQSRENILWLNKYARVKLILSETEYALQGLRSSAGGEKGTRVIGVTSAAGGTGKTTAALGLAYSLASQHRRVLFLSAEQLQSYSVYLKNREPIGNEAYRIMREKADRRYAVLRHHIRQEVFHYLPPVGATLDSLQIPFSVYGELAAEIRDLKEYDYIILDMDSGCDGRNAHLMEICDHVILVLRQDVLAVRKSNFMLQNIDYSNTEKYVFICNRFDGSRENVLSDPDNERITISEYIKEMADVSSLRTIAETEEMQNLTFLFL